MVLLVGCELRASVRVKNRNEGKAQDKQHAYKHGGGVWWTQGQDREEEEEEHSITRALGL